MEESEKPKEEYNWLKTLAIGFGIAGVGVALALVLYFLFGRS